MSSAAQHLSRSAANVHADAALTLNCVNPSAGSDTHAIASGPYAFMLMIHRRSASGDVGAVTRLDARIDGSTLLRAMLFVLRLSLTKFYRISSFHGLCYTCQHIE